MTAPEPPPAGPPPPEEEDESALLPALLIIYAAYLLWRGAHDRLTGGWRGVADDLRLRESVGGQLAMIAARAMQRQRDAAGYAGDELWQHAGVGMAAGVDAGVQAIVEALLWTDRGASGDPVSKDTGGRVPTASSPPDLLAALTVQAVVNAAVVAVARAAGWQGKTWRTRLDRKVRDAHQAMEGQRKLINQPFIAPGGFKLRYPGDPKAPIELVANCRCRAVPTRR